MFKAAIIQVQRAVYLSVKCIDASMRTNAIYPYPSALNLASMRVYAMLFFKAGSREQPLAPIGRCILDYMYLYVYTICSIHIACTNIYIGFYGPHNKSGGFSPYTGFSLAHRYVSLEPHRALGRRALTNPLANIVQFIIVVAN